MSKTLFKLVDCLLLNRTNILRSLQGLVSSKGQFGIPDCSYVMPHSGGMHFEFQIYYDKCGTKPDMGGKFYENTIIIQYDADLIEVSLTFLLRFSLTKHEFFLWTELPPAMKFVNGQDFEMFSKLNQSKLVN